MHLQRRYIQTYFLLNCSTSLNFSKCSERVTGGEEGNESIEIRDSENGAFCLFKDGDLFPLLVSFLLGVIWEKVINKYITQKKFFIQKFGKEQRD